MDKQNKKKEQIIYTAYHEAGHVIMAYSLGIPSEFVEVNHSDENGKGLTRYDPRYIKHEDTILSEAFTDIDDVLILVKTLLAGEISENLYKNNWILKDKMLKEITISDNSNCDWNRAEKITNYHHIDIFKIRSEVFDLISQNNFRNAIKILANELLKIDLFNPSIKRIEKKQLKEMLDGSELKFL